MPSKPKPPSHSPQPKDVYTHALWFLGTEAFLRRQIDADASLMPMLQYPGMVICAFAAELFLKCLILLEGGTPKNTHNLLTLFEQLSAKHRALVERHWDTGCRARKDSIDAMEKQYNVTIPRDLKTALTDCGDAFKLLRYVYESPKKPLFYITHLPTSLRFAIQEITGWNP